MENYIDHTFLIPLAMPCTIVEGAWSLDSIIGYLWGPWLGVPIVPCLDVEIRNALLRCTYPTMEEVL